MVSDRHGNFMPSSGRVRQSSATKRISLPNYYAHNRAARTGSNIAARADSRSHFNRSAATASFG
jgi:hypothetical protein